ncbi:MAG TPA: PilC/PilY family type IV pilus protein [Candidatus Competibacter sp.]|nr:PilC/PilY family type IV pilus protein [Candidatus Competibacter sp.]
MGTNFYFRAAFILVISVLAIAIKQTPAMATPAQKPLYLGYNAPPMMLLTMQRDHRLFYEAYDDLSDLNGDGTIETRYKPDLTDSTGSPVNYYGYFDSYKCYDYSTSTSGSRFIPAIVTLNKKCSGKWSGDFLNYVTMTRMDTLRKVLYGGMRSTDNGPNNSPANLTILERSYIPQESHMFGKEYTSLSIDNFKISDYTPLSEPASGKRHLFANMTLNNTTDPLLRVVQNVSSSYHIWDWISKEATMGGNSLQDGTSVNPTNYVVRIEVCKTTLPKEDNCVGYPRVGAATTYKPTGILHDYGENNSMYFGLMTGSYANNLRGGVLRRSIGSFLDEINVTTGQFKKPVNTTTFPQGNIVATLDNIKITGFSGGTYDSTNCSFSTFILNSLTNGKCTWWGNPIAEMMYEGLRYFSGAKSPTSTFNYSKTDSTLDDNVLGLPLPNWDDPYAESKKNWCAKSFQTVLSDTMPTFDSDNLPGSAFTGTISSGLYSLNVSSEADTIWVAELGVGPRNIIIGETTTNNNQAPTPKATSGFSSIRGLTPEDPNKQGSYYAAAVAAYGKTHDINATQGDQKVDTFAIALSSTTPRIEIPVTVNGKNQTIRIVPFGKTVSTGGRSNTEPATGLSSGLITTPQNTGILRMYVESIKNVPPFTAANIQDMSDNGGRPHYRFRVHFGDTEYGGDFDMDALALYDIKLNSTNTLDVKITVDSNDPVIADRSYAQAGYNMHIGYVISGTTKDGTKLLIRNPGWTACTAADIADVRYQLDGDCATDSNPVNCVKTDPTKNGHTNFSGRTVNNSSSTACSYTNSLPFSRTVTFTPKAPPLPTVPPTPVSDGEFIEYDPLWYAAKWGGFLDGYVKDIDAVVPSRKNNALDSGEEFGEWEKRDDLGNIIRDSDGNPKEPRNYFPVTNAGTLARVLDKAFEMAVEQTSSSSAAATNSGYAQAPDRIYQAKFSPRYWFGQLIAYPINKTTGEIDTTTVIFDAATLIPQESDRKIFSYRPADDYSDPTNPTVLDKKEGGFEFLWTNFSDPEKAFLNLSTSLITADDRQATLYYVRGKRDWTGCTTPPCKSEASGTFRKRNADTVVTGSNDKPVLGDIINSSPIFVGNQDLGYSAASDLAGYSGFVTDVKQTRDPMIYAGANDGMLHAFDAKTGVERFAYIPHAVFSGVGANKLSDLTRKGLPHQYYVDGSVAVGDVCLNASNTSCSEADWKSVLVGTLGVGGKAVYALDVTNPASFGSGKVMWEFTHPELGYATGQPLIVRLNDGNWYVVIGNGYESYTCDSTFGSRYDKDPAAGLPICKVNPALDARNAKLFLIKINPDLSDGWDEGTDYFVIHATNNTTVPTTHTPSSDNALAMPGGLNRIKGMTGDLDFDFKADMLYAGDMQGHLWRFDLSSATPADWMARAIFQAKDSSGNAQPISVQPAIMQHPVSGYIVVFGTGRYIYGDAAYIDDPADKETQTLYGIRDNTEADPNWTVTGRSQLQQQTITKETTEIFGAYRYGIRDVSTIAINWDTQKGWYLDLLQPPSGTQQGERVTETALFTGGERVLFNTKIPSTDACSAGGSSWVMEIDATSGGRTTTETFDLNRDQMVNASDHSNFGSYSEKVVVSGIQRLGGASEPPSVCGMTSMGTPYCNEGKSVIKKTFSCTNGSLYTETDAVTDSQFCGSGFKRTSWRQLQ